MTLGELSERTGIPERELLLFSLGEIGLKASDRFAILEELATHQPETPRRALRPGTLETFKKLLQEVEDEDSEENSE